MTREKDLRCPSCRRWYKLEELFDNCKGAWRSGLGFECKRCRVSATVVLGPKTITIGSIDGGPGPCFIPAGRIKVQYSLRREKGAIRVRYAGREWTFARH